MYVEDAAGPTPVRVKEVGTTTVACPMLSSTTTAAAALKTGGFEDVVGRLKAYEERIRGEDGGDEQRVMLTRVSSGDAGSSNGAGGGGRSSSGGAGSSNDVGGQRVMFTRSNGGCESSGDGRNTGGGSGGGSGFLSREKKEVKQKWGKDNSGGFINSDGSGSSGGSSGSGLSIGSGSKAQSLNKPNSNKSLSNSHSLIVITRCSQKQDTVALSSCEAEFMAATAAACQAIWLQDLLGEIMNKTQEKVVLRVDNKSAIELTKNPVFHGRSKHIHTRFHFIRNCVENEQVEVEYIPGEKHKADILTKPLARTKFKEMRSLLESKTSLEGLRDSGVIVGILSQRRVITAF